MVKVNKVNDLEAILQEVLQPVAPRPEFVQGLKHRLGNKPEVVALTPRSGFVQYAWWTTAGVLSGTLLLVFGIRAVQQLKQKASSQLQTAM